MEDILRANNRVMIRRNPDGFGYFHIHAGTNTTVVWVHNGLIKQGYEWEGNYSRHEYTTFTALNAKFHKTKQNSVVLKPNSGTLAVWFSLTLPEENERMIFEFAGDTCDVVASGIEDNRSKYSQTWALVNVFESSHIKFFCDRIDRNAPDLFSTESTLDETAKTITDNELRNILDENVLIKD
jgi:hypothetical protein